MAEILTVDIIVDYEDPLESLKELVKQIKPEWDVDKVTYEDKSTGYINRNLKVFPAGSDDAFIVRCVTKGFDPSFINFQQFIHRFVDQVNLGPQVLCNIQNGIAVEFLEGEIMTWDTRRGISDDKLWPQTAEILATWHSKAIHDKAQEYGIPDKTIHNNAEVVKGPVNALKNSDPESDFCKALPDVNSYEEEMTWIFRTASKLSPEKRFIHMDANPTNWVVSDERTTIIDYDATGIFFPTADIAWFFLTHTDYRDMDMNEYPSVEHQRKWLEHYLAKRRQLDGEVEPVTDEAVEKFREEVDVGLLYALFQGVFSMIVIMVLNQKEGPDSIKKHGLLRVWDVYKEHKAKYVKKGYL